MVFTGACGALPERTGTGEAQSVRLLFAGDIMLGRGVAPTAASDPDGLFSDVRRQIRSADIAAANVESPLTTRPHSSPNPFAVEADPDAARLLAHAGFDVLGIANNHAGDAGPESVTDSVSAIVDAGMLAVGGGADRQSAWDPVIVEVGGIRTVFLAIDASGQGLAATDEAAGIASWDAARAEPAIRRARSDADIVAVGIHGGIEYWTGDDPLLGPIAETLAAWGVDIVWGHGPHVEQPVTVIDPDDDDRPTVVATSLGNFLFDQLTTETSNGLLLEILVDRDGVIAHRIGGKHHDDIRVHFSGWRSPHSDAARVAGSWWAIDRAIAPTHTAAGLASFSEGTVVNAGRGDLTADGSHEYLVSYRHPVRAKPGDPLPDPPVDAAGMSAHLGVLDTNGTPIWLSRRPPHPVGAVAACDGSAAFAYTTLDDEAVVATGAGVWSGFGFVLDEELPGPGTATCADVDGDGRLDPVVLDRRRAARAPGRYAGADAHAGDRSRVG